jgi:hypothetical protein
VRRCCEIVCNIVAIVILSGRLLVMMMTQLSIGANAVINHTLNPTIEVCLTLAPTYSIQLLGMPCGAIAVCVVLNACACTCVDIDRAPQASCHRARQSHERRHAERVRHQVW